MQTLLFIFKMKWKHLFSGYQLIFFYYRDGPPLSNFKTHYDPRVKTFALSCYRETGPFISSFMRPLRKGVMTFLHPLSPKQNHIKGFGAFLGFLFLAPWRPPAAALGESGWENPADRLEEEQRPSKWNLIPPSTLLLPSLSRPAMEGSGGRHCVVVWVSVFVFFPPALLWALQ